MRDRDRIAEVLRQRRWGLLAWIVAANVVVATTLAGIALLGLLVGLYVLDWLGVLPCLCV